MDRLLRGKEMAQITYMPIRHHSPACAFHVGKLIEAINPDCILIEGPENANPLIPVLAHEETKAPFAIYYSYQDSGGFISEEKESYKCYYPFLDYSPELVALRMGRQRQIHTAFIDLPYGEILIAAEDGRGLRRRDEKNNYNDDYLLARSTYIRHLCENAGLRSFDEFWEKYFEINGLREDSETLIRHMEAYCRSARESTPVWELEAEGCLRREAYMADCIRRYIEEQSFQNLLVVTGGFHAPGLKKLMEHGGDSGFTEEKSGIECKRPSLRGLKPENQGVYMMPYSMEASDALNGYASGMPYPGFYQKIWNGINGGSERVYEEAVLTYLVATGREVRKKEECLSSYDEICAYSMTQGLAALRGKWQPGVYELCDAVLSSYVKGEYNLSTDSPMRLLRKQLTGNQIGVLCRDAAVPPIILDFYERCRIFGLKVQSTLEQEVVLTVFASRKHRAVSEFLNQLIFLDTGFARKIKGSDLQRKKDKNLIREIWSYQWNSRVSASLIDQSVHGATVYEACVSLVLAELKKDKGAKETVLLLTRVFEMGLKHQLELVYELVHKTLLSEGDFYSLAEALSYLMMLEELSLLYQSVLEVEKLIKICCQKLLVLLPSMAQVQEKELADCMKACKTLYQLMKRLEDIDSMDQLYSSFRLLLDREKLNPGLEGCVRGLLYGGGQSLASEVEAACRGYLTGTRDQLLLTASFLRGLFYTARDLVFIGDQFMGMIDGFLNYVDEVEFMELLPELKLAFGYFTPREIDQIAGQAAALHGKSKKELFALEEVSPVCYAYGKKLDQYTAAVMERKSHG